MRILGIETSCDETAAAVVRDGHTVDSSLIASTKEVFANTGGVVPEDAARRQVECILPVLHEALAKAEVTTDDIDCLAVTKGPGLMGSLLIGTTTARTLASLWQKPLIGVHHTFGHLSSPWPAATTPPQFPCITLSVSGGHSDIWYRTSHTSGTLLGRTRDDAAGEAFDKAAAMLGLPYPGGPSIAKAATTGDEHRYSFPLALSGKDTCDLSFSGVKTALKNTIADISPLRETDIPDLAASFQLAICAQLADRVQRACTLHSDTQEVHIVGGVSANIRLRELIANIGQLPVRTPSALSYCTDNAAMIAAGAYFLYQETGEAAYDDFVTSATVPLSDCVH